MVTAWGVGGGGRGYKGINDKGKNTIKNKRNVARRRGST